MRCVLHQPLRLLLALMLTFPFFMIVCVAPIHRFTLSVSLLASLRQINFPTIDYAGCDDTPTFVVCQPFLFFRQGIRDFFRLEMPVGVMPVREAPAINDIGCSSPRKVGNR